MQRLQVIEMFEVFAKEGEIICKSKKKNIEKNYLENNASKCFKNVSNNRNKKHCKCHFLNIKAENM